jgi:hypothetical protein
MRDIVGGGVFSVVCHEFWLSGIMADKHTESKMIS